MDRIAEKEVMASTKWACLSSNASSNWLHLKLLITFNIIQSEIQSNRNTVVAFRVFTIHLYFSTWGGSTYTFLKLYDSTQITSFNLTHRPWTNLASGQLFEPQVVLFILDFLVNKMTTLTKVAGPKNLVFRILITSSNFIYSCEVISVHNANFILYPTDLNSLLLIWFNSACNFERVDP